MSVLRPGLVLRGFRPKVSYAAIRPIRKECPRVWLGRTHDGQNFILKEALNHDSYRPEVKALNEYLRGHKSFRQLVHVIANGHHVMVLEHHDQDLHHVLHEMRAKKMLEEVEVKRIAKVELQGLVPMHERGVAYTDATARSIVVDFDERGSFSNIKSIDLGDAVTAEPAVDFAHGNLTTQTPEALFGIPWTTKVDIWGLGTLVFRYHHGWWIR